MTQHAAEILPVVIWIMVALGSALIGLLSWIGAFVWKRLGDIAELLRAIERDLRADLSDLDRRVAKIEGRCSVQHDD